MVQLTNDCCKPFIAQKNFAEKKLSEVLADNASAIKSKDAYKKKFSDMEKKYNDMLNKFNGKNQEVKYLQDHCIKAKGVIDQLMTDWPVGDGYEIMAAPQQPGIPLTPSPSRTEVSLS